MFTAVTQRNKSSPIKQKYNGPPCIPGHTHVYYIHVQTQLTQNNGYYLNHKSGTVSVVTGLFWLPVITLHHQ